MERDVGELGRHPRQQELVAVVVAKDDVDRTGESLGNLIQGERCAEIATKDQRVRFQPIQQSLQLPNVVVDVRQNCDLDGVTSSQCGYLYPRSISVPFSIHLCKFLVANPYLSAFSMLAMPAA